MADQAPTLYPGLRIPAFFEYQNRPARVMNPLRLPEELVDGTWQKVADPGRFQQEAYRLKPEKFDQLVASMEK